jgi:sugar lactone lactonase YvrE
LATDRSGNIYVADTYNSRIQKFGPSGALIAVLASNGELDHPRALAVDLDGTLYVADENSNSVKVLSTDGAVLSSWGGTGTGPGQFARPQGIAIGPTGNIFVSDTDNARVQVFLPSGVYLTQWFSGTAQRRGSPVGIAVDKFGDVYVVDAANRTVTRSTATGIALAQWGDYQTMGSPVYLAVDRASNVFVSDANMSGPHRVLKFTSTGKLISEITTSNGSGQFFFPSGLATDPDGNLYVAQPTDRCSCQPQGEQIQKFGGAPTSTSNPTWGGLKTKYR